MARNYARLFHGRVDLLIEKRLIACIYALFAIFLFSGDLRATGGELASIQTRKLLLRKLDDLRQHGKGAEVIACCNQILHIDPRCAYAYRVRGLTWVELGKSPVGLEDLNRALALGDKNTELYNYLAQALTDARKLDAAMDALDQGLKIEPRNVYFLRQKGELYSEMKDYPKAHASLAKAIEIDPKSTDNYISLGHIYFAAGDFKKAIDEYTAAIKINPADLRVFGYRATAYQKLGNLDQYRADIKKANSGVFDF